LSRLSLDRDISSSYGRQHGIHEPVAKTVPQVPPCNPIFFVDVGHVTAHLIVWSGLRPGIGHDSQDLDVLGGLRNLVPFEWSCHG
jgi:hypothetical protein